MNSKQKQALALRETDYEGAIYRCCGDEKLYTKCLKLFLRDKTISQLIEAINKHKWDDAFTAAHALKGLAGNMGFVPLTHATGQLVVLIRGGRTKEIDEAMENVESSYRDISDAIRQFISYQAKK